MKMSKMHPGNATSMLLSKKHPMELTEAQLAAVHGGQTSVTVLPWAFQAAGNVTVQPQGVAWAQPNDLDCGTCLDLGLLFEPVYNNSIAQLIGTWTVGLISTVTTLLFKFIAGRISTANAQQNVNQFNQINKDPNPQQNAEVQESVVNQAENNVNDAETGDDLSESIDEEINILGTPLNQTVPQTVQTVLVDVEIAEQVVQDGAEIIAAF